MNEKVMNRYLVVVGAILIQLCLGAIYAWSVFTPALMASKPNQIVAVYGAKQLGLEQEKFDAMKADLETPQAKLKEVSAKLKGTTDAEEKKTLGDEKKATLAEIDSIVEKNVSAEKLESLAYGLTTEDTQNIFAAGLAAFAVVMVLAGRLMPKFGPRNLAMAGGVILGLGYILAGTVAGNNFYRTYKKLINLVVEITLKR